MQLQTAPLSTSSRKVTIWLFICLIMIACMVIVGGLTRLTESGLSIVEWKPVTGTLPPLTEEAFEQEFALYKGSPEFQKMSPNMSLDEYKHIYWLEYIHRLLARVVVLVTLVPLFYFSSKKMITREQTIKFFLIFSLIGAQALLGWYMVQSGLKDVPRVSPYFLAGHLTMGFTLFGLILWQLLNCSYPDASLGDMELAPPGMFLKSFSCFVVIMIFLQVILGASVAGQHAGMTFNTFPRMDGQWIPDGIWPFESWHQNLFQDVITAQFFHRMIAYVIAIIIPSFWLLGHNNPHVAHLLPILFSIFIIQFMLGVLTLLFIVPIPLASLHQANALLLFGIALTIVHRLFVPLKTIAYSINNTRSALV